MADKTARGRFVWHELNTPDTAAAHAFYGKTLGWKSQPWEQDPSYSMFAAGSGPLGALGRIGIAAGGGLGALLAGYTGVLLANTAVPLWQAARRQLPVLFVGSGMASAGAVLPGRTGEASGDGELTEGTGAEDVEEGLLEGTVAASRDGELPEGTGAASGDGELTEGTGAGDAEGGLPEGTVAADEVLSARPAPRRPTVISHSGAASASMGRLIGWARSAPAAARAARARWR